DARIVPVERGRDLHDQRHVLRSGSVVGVGEILVARDLAFVRRRVAVDVDVRSIERAVAAIRTVYVHQRPVVVVDRDLSQLGRGRVERVGGDGRGAGKARLAQPTGCQVVRGAFIGQGADRAHDEIRLEIEGYDAVAAPAAAAS